MASILDNAGARALLGLGASGLENATLFRGSNPNLQHMNLLLGAATGMGAPEGLAEEGGASRAGEFLLKNWVPKQGLMFGLDQGEKFIRQQEPIAQTNLATARLNEDAAHTTADAAKHLTPSDLARLGMAGAGLAGAGGLGYYLYKTLGAGKPPPKAPQPRLSVGLNPGSKGVGDVRVEGPEDAFNLSKKLHQYIARDTKRKIRQEGKANTHHTFHTEAPATKEACMRYLEKLASYL